MSLNLFSSPLLRNVSPIASVLATCRWYSTSSTAGLSAFTSQRATNTQHVRIHGRRRLPDRLKFLKDQKSQAESRAMEKFQSRDWKAGDIYAPHDLSPAEMSKWANPGSAAKDPFDAINQNPLNLYKNFSIMSEYISATGRIRHRNQTGLRPVNQRRLAKAIRRARGVGLLPSVHRHPEILAGKPGEGPVGGSGF